MDKGDKIIKQKVKKAKPYQPVSDWGKMEGMLAADEKAVGGARISFLRGFLLGVASIAALLFLLWVILPFDSEYKQMANQEQTNPQLQEDKISSQVEEHYPEEGASQEKPSSIEASSQPDRYSQTKKPQDRTSSLPLSPASKANNKLLADDKEGKKGGSKLSSMISSSAAESNDQASKELPPALLEAGIIKRLSPDNADIPVSLPSSLRGISSPGQIIPYPTLSSRKWKAGLYLSGMIQPFVAASPSGLTPSQNPLIYRWHPGVSVRLSREISRQHSLGIALGSDDVYYYEGYLPAGSFPSASYQSPGNSVGLIVGSNLSAELFYKWKWRKKAGRWMDPYANILLGFVQSQTDFVEIFELNEEQLQALPKASRFRAKENLSTFLNNPYLVNNRVFVDVSDEQVVTSEALSSTYSLSNNLSSFVKTNFASLGAGVGSEFHLTSRWDLDLQANLLSRVQIREIRTAGGLNEFSGINQQNRDGRTEPIPRNLAFVQLSAGMNWNF